MINDTVKLSTVLDVLTLSDVMYYDVDITFCIAGDEDLTHTFIVIQNGVDVGEDIRVKLPALLEEAAKRWEIVNYNDGTVYPIGELSNYTTYRINQTLDNKGRRRYRIEAEYDSYCKTIE